jgi:hypothetical protein
MGPEVVVGRGRGGREPVSLSRWLLVGMSAEGSLFELIETFLGPKGRHPSSFIRHSAPLTPKEPGPGRNFPFLERRFWELSLAECRDSESVP